MAPMDKPAQSLEMIRRFLFGESFEDVYLHSESVCRITYVLTTYDHYFLLLLILGFYASLQGEDIPTVDDDIEMAADDMEQEGRVRASNTLPSAVVSSEGGTEWLNNGGVIIVGIALVAIVVVVLPRAASVRFGSNR